MSSRRRPSSVSRWRSCSDPSRPRRLGGGSQGVGRVDSPTGFDQAAISHAATNEGASAELSAASRSANERAL